jgi:hypothetical protein
VERACARQIGRTGDGQIVPQGIAPAMLRSENGHQKDRSTWNRHRKSPPDRMTLYDRLVRALTRHATAFHFQRDSVPLSIIMDGSKEQTMGEFRKKTRAAGCRIKQTEPYSPWQNAAESAIRELKRVAGRKMIESKCPRWLWDHCIELESMIRSSTALDSYELNGQVPETIVSGQTADISPFVEYSWYDWVKYYDKTASFPNPKELIGRWLGPTVDLGPAMTAKIDRIYTRTSRSQGY